MKFKVVIMTRSFGSTSDQAWQILKAAGCETLRVDINKASDQDIIAAIRDADGMIIGARQITAAMIEAAPQLKVISMHGVGVNHIDLEAAKARHIAVTNCPGANANGVADLTLGLMLALARQIPQGHALLARGEWQNMEGVEIWEKTLGLIGLGRIGKGVAKRAAAGFNMHVLVYDPYITAADVSEFNGEAVALEQLLGEADFISLHAPLTDETRNLIDAAALRKMKPSAFLINTARGELVDEKALYDALTQNLIAGAALDAFCKEPPGNDPLLKLPNVVATPHIGAHSREAITNASVMSARNTVDVLLTGSTRFRVV